MKRSSQVALLLMGVTGVGASSYALIPRSDCPPATVPGTAAPVASPTACQPGRSHFTSHGSGGNWSRPIFSHSDSSTRIGTSAPSGRGGFGSTGAAHSTGS